MMELGYPPAFRPPGVIWQFSLQTSVPAQALWSLSRLELG